MTPPTPPASWPTSADYETLRAGRDALAAENEQLRHDRDWLRETVLDLDDDVEQARRIACALEGQNAAALALLNTWRSLVRLPHEAAGRLRDALGAGDPS
jgi:hypothetical protein